MTDDRISVSDASAELGLIKQTAFKILGRLNITPTKERSERHRNQTISYITQAEFQQLSEYELQSSSDSGEGLPSASGVFYLIQLEPEFDSGRFKLGFTSSLSERLRHLRCSAPFAIVIETWSCKQLWEKTAIESVARGCEQIHTEVFRAESIEDVAGRAAAFFAQMPTDDLLPERGEDGGELDDPSL